MIAAAAASAALFLSIGHAKQAILVTVRYQQHPTEVRVFDCRRRSPASVGCKLVQVQIYEPHHEGEPRVIEVIYSTATATLERFRDGQVLDHVRIR